VRIAKKKDFFQFGLLDFWNAKLLLF
jgi:hypothetical protein